jgi:phosphoesterase RecJ-like protein
MVPDPTLTKIEAFLEKHSRFFVLGHREPDGDCVASQLVLTRWLRSRGKRAEAVSAGPFDRAEILGWASEFRRTVERKADGASEAVVLIDCSHYDRVGLELPQLRGLPLLVIDHHSSPGGAAPDGEGISLIDPSYASTSLLLFDLLSALGGAIDANTADLLLFGFCTDTGYFRHLNETHADQMLSVAGLVRAGASPQRIYRMIYGNRDLEYIRLLGAMLSRVKAHREGRLLLTWQTRRDRKGLTSCLRGSDELFRLLFAAAGVQVAVLVTEEDDGSCSVSLRSIGDFDVGRAALLLGGGGHRNAAGYTSSNGLKRVKREIVRMVSGELGQRQAIHLRPP